MTTPTSSDRTLSVQQLFVQHHLALRSFVVALVPDFNVAQDVLQETFLTVTAKANDFCPGSNFFNWACTIARFKILEAVRERKTKILPAAAIESLCAVELPAYEDRRLEVLTTCIEGLAPHSRKIIELRYTESHSPTEIARIIGWTTKAVNVALSRARRVLRDCVCRKLTSVPVARGGV